MVEAVRTVAGPVLAVPVAPAEVAEPEAAAAVRIEAEAALEVPEAAAAVVAPEVPPVGAERPGVAPGLQVEAPAVQGRRSGPGERYRQ